MSDHFDPTNLDDLNMLADMIRDLPGATADEIAARFAHTVDNWKQGDRPTFVQPDDLDERLQLLLADASRAVEEKTCTNGGPFKDPDGSVWWTPDLTKPYYGCNWSYETLEDEKYFRVNLVLDAGPKGSSWVPFVFMRRTDDVVAFWFHDSINAARL